MDKIPKSLIVLLAAIVAVVVGSIYGVGATVSMLAGFVLLLVIFTLWSSLQNLTGDAPLSFEEALSLGAVTPEEERKRAILRALKDLEYERSVGKISEEDFQELSAQYRAEARQLLQELDEGLAPARRQAEELLQLRLGKDPDADEDAADGDEDEDAEEEAAVDEDTQEPAAKEVAGAASSHLECPECAGQNDEDASFCKHCGAPMRPGASHTAVTEATEGSDG